MCIRDRFYLFFMAAEVMVGNILLMPAAKVTQYLAAHPALMLSLIHIFSEDYQGGNAFRQFAESKGCRFLSIAHRGESFELPNL